MNLHRANWRLSEEVLNLVDIIFSNIVANFEAYVIYSPRDRCVNQKSCNLEGFVSNLHKLVCSFKRVCRVLNLFSLPKIRLSFSLRCCVHDLYQSYPQIFQPTRK